MSASLRDPFRFQENLSLRPPGLMHSKNKEQTHATRKTRHKTPGPA